MIPIWKKKIRCFKCKLQQLNACTYWYCFNEIKQPIFPGTPLLSLFINRMNEQHYTSNIY